MDELDAHLIAALKRNGRASLSELAAQLGVTRSTVRVRLDRLVQGGEIAGFTVLTRSDVRPDPVRGLMMLEIAGRGAEKVMKQLQRMTEVQAVHSTNGTWDLIAEIGTDTLEKFDQALFAIRRLDGVTRSETNLLLSTRR
ncbi:AsnC family transcriptional regulator [Loktanella sp. PT4BL]|jgi:DNA-binding Lrp family transcriptional regulator|uniref:Lrp/AsnC family transcriptional regulator n=1 Tax=Rhodobacterales TaxID=204455 RepID=UPI000D758C99|nr:Lrp/AsnC family transcriptional regulator [Loktanella sp. PT4BL]PXW70380.1 AsnC family transcriptional regulator [Loktanella sp. PT4BL]